MLVLLLLNTFDLTRYSTALSWNPTWQEDEGDKAFQIDLNVRILGFQNWLFTILLLRFNICFRVFFSLFLFIFVSCVCVSDSCQSKYRVARIVYVFLRVRNDIHSLPLRTHRLRVYIFRHSIRCFWRYFFFSALLLTFFIFIIDYYRFENSI